MNRSLLLLLGACAALVALLGAAGAARTSGLRPVAPYPSARAVAEALGCTGYAAGLPAPVLGVSVAGKGRQPEFGTCTYRGHLTEVGWSGTGDVTYVVFHDLDPTDAGRGYLLHGLGWTVRCARAADRDEARGRLGGVPG